jgi:primosomal protein N' (replication factor Y)
MLYPPVWHMMVIMCAGASEENTATGVGRIAEYIRKMTGEGSIHGILNIIGPTDPAIAKINDIYRKVIYIKSENYEELVTIKDRIEHFIRDNRVYRDVSVQFDFDPVNGF